ncbi:hypothetical protein SYNPS1DRAFT_30895 [Syncephalis pseudoplumigaleata]|uniref:Uncharacterized protein n=1 Tax=Syncephalis pseudoplumigaleata TaxID=1712513 RepID=A0A4P9YTX2_9FUNG|nr:hypothetical protein SYNPS1DRAFT_30895 [Syncephalis pseudoplumigaleata]|eukprot:RKP23367.1 hypothetical protein SYNPS1DRAFT_30895 [Syncephalis pseudoplumigaleata]
MPFEKGGVPTIGTNRMPMTELADFLRTELMISLDKAEGVVSSVKRVPLHHPTLCLVRNQKRILAHHVREFDTTIRALARGGTVLPEELARSPASSTSVSPSSSFSVTLPPVTSAIDGEKAEFAMADASSSSSSSSSSPPPLYQCDEIHANVRVIRFPSLARLVSAQRVLKANYPRAFYISPELRERLRSVQSLPQIPIGWCWVIVRTSLSEVEVERMDWFFHL